jgi:hypothetical protein
VISLSGEISNGLKFPDHFDNIVSCIKARM